jgi:Fe-S oxidoreductase
MFWNVPADGRTLFLVLGYAVCVVSVLLAARRLRAVFRGRDRLLFSALPQRLKRLTIDAIGQAGLRKKHSAARYHDLLVIGLLLLVGGTCLVGIEYHFDVPILRGRFYLIYEAVLDLMGLLFIAGVLLAMRRPEILDRPPTRDPLGDRGLLLLLLVIAVSAFAVEGLRLAATQPDYAAWSFAGFGIAKLIGYADLDIDTLRNAHLVWWWGHSLLALGFIAIAPLTRMFHVLSAPLNIFFQPLRPRGALATPFDIVNNSEQTVAADPGVRLGPAVIEEFTRAALLATEACTECGRCHELCPAHATGKPLSPMGIVLKLRDALHSADEGRGNLVGEAPISTEELASCTTCGACVEACPVTIDQVGMVVELRRGRVDEGILDGGHRAALVRTREQGNPWGMSPEDREAWLEGQGVETVRDGETYDILYWLGCAASFDSRMREIAKAMFEILRAAGLSFGVLGKRECCSGDLARRAGDEGLFQRLVAKNLATFADLSATRILTHCPHCFNSFKNEYPDFGTLPPVIHHTQLIAALLDEGRLVTTRRYERKLVYHDPCYLGRYNDTVDAPRAALGSVAGLQLTEACQAKKQSRCCGAGGAHMWRTQEGGSARFGATRLIQLTETGATQVATACPFCMAMLEEASQGSAERLAIRDISEIIRDSL